MTATADLKAQLTPERKRPVSPIPSKDFARTPSTLLNLGLSGRIDGGIPIGSYVLFNGDSQSGKTIVSNGVLAEASINSVFDKYDFYYNNPENGLKLDTIAFFGAKLAKRIKPPAVDKKGRPRHTQTIEEFYYHMDDLKKLGRPFIEVLDSQDALFSEDAEEKFHEQKDAYRKGQDAAGSYGDGKAKKHSANLRWVNSYLEKTGGILIIINQSRDNIGFGAAFNPKTRSGGWALKFYATFELWSSVIGQIKVRVGGKDRQVGTRCKIHVKKNRVTGHDVSVEVPILRTYGVDDIGSCIDYLLDEGHWDTIKEKKKEDEPDEDDNDEEKKKKKKKAIIAAPELDIQGTRDSIIQQVGAGDMEQELRLIVGNVWNEIERKCEEAVRRKPRY